MGNEEEKIEVSEDGLRETYGDVELVYIHLRECKVFKGGLWVGYIKDIGNNRFALYDVCDKYIKRVTGKKEAVNILKG